MKAEEVTKAPKRPTFDLLHTVSPSSVSSSAASLSPPWGGAGSSPQGKSNNLWLRLCHVAAVDLEALWLFFCLENSSASV